MSEVAASRRRLLTAADEERGRLEALLSQGQARQLSEVLKALHRTDHWKRAGEITVVRLERARRSAFCAGRKLRSRTLQSHETADLARTLPMVPRAPPIAVWPVLESAALLVSRGQEPPFGRRHFTHPRASLGVKSRVRGRTNRAAVGSACSNSGSSSTLGSCTRVAMGSPFHSSRVMRVYFSPFQRKTGAAPGCVDVFVRLGTHNPARECGITPHCCVAQNRRAVARRDRRRETARSKRRRGGRSKPTNSASARTHSAASYARNVRFLSRRRGHRKAYRGNSRDHRGQGDRPPSRDSPEPPLHPD